MEERRITEKESLEVITAMIARTKERYMLGEGNIMLMWGYLTVGVSALIWILLVATHNPVWNWLWYLIWIIGGTVTPIMARRKVHKFGVKSYSDRLSSRIWSTVGFSAILATFVCLGFLLIGGKDSWGMMFAFALIIVPLAEICQGIVINENSMVAGGWTGLAVGIFTVCCIAGGVPLGVNWYLPIFILAFTGMLIVPGHVLNYKAKKEEEER